ncbi:hypothetical protein BDV34DRAFT_185111 [Aspergillus parasiticus]|uniref:Uncharacterized protein n=1 Tax=Aspergillus parasiticus TaxID=5067 RepID=A0A5N6E3D4_ASPPA|nr:hypothetical protein BDV34DRAFT_185111 [Aspergillus parasiticus]
MSALTRDPQMLQKGRSRTFLWDFFSSFSSLHRKALTEPATTVVQSLSHGDVLPSVYGLIGSEEQKLLDRKFAFRWVLFSEGDEG